MSRASCEPAGPFASPLLLFASKSHGPMFFDDITSISGENAAYSVQRSNRRALGVSGVARYPPRSAVHSGIPLRPAPSPAVTTVGRPFSGEKLASLSPPHRKPMPFAPTVTLRARSTPLPFRSFWINSSTALLYSTAYFCRIARASRQKYAVLYNNAV